MTSELQDFEQERYQRYLCSREWGVLKEQVRLRSGGTCERCRVNAANAVHHITYIRKYQEVLDDLIHLCEPCHNFIHGKSDADPCEPTFESPVIVTDTGWWDGTSVLHCPYCRSDCDYLHQGQVTIYDRSEEDGDVTEISILRGHVFDERRPSSKSNNPSSRRDAIAIRFECENCGKEDFELTILQHKGQTFLAWRKYETHTADDDGRERDEENHEEIVLRTDGRKT